MGLKTALNMQLQFFIQKVRLLGLIYVGFAGRSLPLPVSAPFHCSLMTAAAQILEPALASIKFKDPDVEVISNVTARPVWLSSK